MKERVSLAATATKNSSEHAESPCSWLKFPADSCCACESVASRRCKIAKLFLPLGGRDAIARVSSVPFGDFRWNAERLGNERANEPVRIERGEFVSFAWFRSRRTRGRLRGFTAKNLSATFLALSLLGAAFLTS